MIKLLSKTIKIKRGLLSVSPKISVIGTIDLVVPPVFADKNIRLIGYKQARNFNKQFKYAANADIPYPLTQEIGAGYLG